MKMAEFLNLDTKQTQWLDTSLEHPNLVRVPEGAECAFEQLIKNHPVGFFKSGHVWSLIDANWKADAFSPYNADRIIYWQRNPLQEKINETLSILNVNKAKLSILLGREKSYVKRLLAKDRNVTEKTKVTVIDQLDQLISQHEQDQEPEDSKCVKKLTVTLSVDTKEVQDELKKAYTLIDQANENSVAWQKKYKDQKNLSLFLTSVISASIVFLALYCLWGVV